MEKAERLFCSKPFEWFEVTQLNGRGGVYLCCPSWLSTPVGNLRQQSVAEVWNSDTAQAIRRSVLDGSFSYCNGVRCPYLQTRSGPVTPVANVANEELKAVIDKNLTALPYGPKKIVCTYDQSCNLSCPTCRTKVIVERESERDILNIQHKLQDEALKDAEFLHMTGSGDPFGSPYFRAWLLSLRRADMPKLDWIHLHTNAMLWTPKMWNAIPAEVQQLVKSTEISIDAATSATYAVNRRGGDFNRLLKNLEFISGLRRSGSLRALKISMVVQENNFSEMPAFVKLGQRYHCDEIYFSQLVNWGSFTAEEFARRAVHIASHPQHSRFVKVLQDPIFDTSTVNLGNLTEIKRAATTPWARRLRRRSLQWWSRVWPRFEFRSAQP
jgi:hypothetical protein